MKKTPFWGSATAKILFVGILLLLMLIPVGMIQGVISERQWRAQEVVREVGEKWGEAQVMEGLVLTVPYTYRWEQRVGEGQNEQLVQRTETRQAHFFPDTLDYRVTLDPQVRRRGIFDAVVYDLGVRVEGEMPTPNMAALDIADTDILWDQTFLSVGIPDTRGITESVPLEWNQSTLSFQPGVGSMDFLSSGIHTPLTGFREGGGINTFAFDLQLKGSQTLSFWPVAKTTEVTVNSPWTAPSFVGRFLPETSDNNETFEDGFIATWKTSYFGRPYPQAWKSPQNQSQYAQVVDSGFGVDLILPVDHYQKNERSIKYAVLFIGLTFLMFFCFEILHKGLRVHPFQYILIGIAMSVFYLLLLSFSEHIGFASAYVISALATTGLITAYSTFVLGAQRKGWSIGLLLAAIYSYLYALLQLEDYALLMGSVVTFLIVALVMWITRKIDWYSVEVGE